MMSGRLAGCAAWRREDWPSCQAARRSLRAFQTSPHRVEFNLLGPALSVRMPQVLVSTDSQSAFADGPAPCEQTGRVTTAILIQCCLKSRRGFLAGFALVIRPWCIDSIWGIFGVWQRTCVRRHIICRGKKERSRAQGRSRAWIGFAYLVLASFLFALPAYLALQRSGYVTVTQSIVAGFVIPSLLGAVLALLPGARGSYAADSGGVTMVDGHLTAHGRRSRLEGAW